MYKHSSYCRVTYAQTDRMGIMYYGNYGVFMEIGRVEALRQLGITYKELEDDMDVIMPVVHLDSRYIRPANYDEVIRVDTTIKELPSTSIKFSHQMFNEKNEIIHDAKIKLVWLKRSTTERISTPQIILDKLNPYFE